MAAKPGDSVPCTEEVTNYKSGNARQTVKMLSMKKKHENTTN